MEAQFDMDTSNNNNHLTSRQQQIMAAVAEGASNRVVAERLGLREQTIKNQLTAIYKKLGVVGRDRLIEAAVREQTS